MKIFATVLMIGIPFTLGVQLSHGAVTFDWATVGNPGNLGELSGESVGFGPEAIVGGVDYAYRISKHEVTAGQYAEFLNAVAASDPNQLYNGGMAGDRGCKILRMGTDGSYTYSVAADWVNRPVNYVSFIDAMRFANWLDNGQPTGPQGSETTEDGVYKISDGKTEIRSKTAKYFIPTEDEWYKAAYYDPDSENYYDYATSTNSLPNHNLIAPDPGNSANYHSFHNYHPLESTYTLGSPYYRTEVGEFENSPSPYGTFDQTGNVWEWNEAVIIAPDLGVPSAHRGIRGGSYDDFVYAFFLRAGSRGYTYSNRHSDTIGFRVAAAIPEPSTQALLMGIAGAMTLMRQRKTQRLV